MVESQYLSNNSVSAARSEETRIDGTPHGQSVESNATDFEHLVRKSVIEDSSIEAWCYFQDRDLYQPPCSRRLAEKSHHPQRIAPPFNFSPSGGGVGFRNNRAERRRDLLPTSKIKPFDIIYVYDCENESWLSHNDNPNLASFRCTTSTEPVSTGRNGIQRTQSEGSISTIGSMAQYFSSEDPLGEGSERLTKTGLVKMLEDSADRLNTPIERPSLALAADAILDEGNHITTGSRYPRTLSKAQLREIFRESTATFRASIDEDKGDEYQADEQIYGTSKMNERHQWLSFLWTLVYIAGQGALFVVSALSAHRQENTFNVFGWCMVYARAFAQLLNLNATLVLLPVSRHLVTWLHSRSTLRRIFAFDRALNSHRLFGWAFVLFSIAHAIFHIRTYLSFAEASNRDLHKQFDAETATMISGLSYRERLEYLLNHRSSITGFLMLICMSAAVAVLSCRRKNFNRFYYFHHLLVLTLILMCIHGTGSIMSPAQTYKWMAAPLFVYLAPRIYRELFARKAIITNVDTCGNVLALTLLQPIEWEKKQKAGMYAMLNIPAVSRFEWHPFTISSAPHQQYLKFHINSTGDWTRTAKSLLATNLNANYGEVGITVRLEGPFGAPAQGSRDYECVVLIGAGIGVTPMISTLCSLLHSPGRMQKVFFYWAVRDNSAFRLFNKEMEGLYEQDLEGRLEIRHFLTSALDAREDDKGSVVLNLATQKVHEKTDLDIRLGHRTRRLMEIGRPDWTKEFGIIANTLRGMGLDRAGVFFCGGHKMASQIKSTAQCISLNENVSLHFKKETF